MTSVTASPVASPRTGRTMWATRRNRYPTSAPLNGDRENGDSVGTRKTSPSPMLCSAEVMSRLGVSASLYDDVRCSPRLSRPSSRNSRSPSSGRSATLLSVRSQDSSSSLSNASPVSTLTGSSEADMHCGSRGARAGGHDHSSDSLASSLSMSLGGRSTSNSPAPSFVASRRHSLTTTEAGQVEELNAFAKRQSMMRRSARSVTVHGPVDPKIRFAQFRPGLLALKPLFFQVPQQEQDPVVWGRSWIFRQLAAALLSPLRHRDQSSSRRGVIVSGLSGSGKTSVALQLVDHSCFGRASLKIPQSPADNVYENPHSLGAAEGLHALASRVVAYHFCQSENSSTCLVADFVHSIAAQLCQAPQLLPFRQLLLSDAHLQGLLTLKSCIANPHQSFVSAILDPLAALKRSGEEGGFLTCLIVVDGLCEAEYHRPDNGDTIASFLARHALQFPHWLKVIVTVRTSLLDATQLLPYAPLSLDSSATNDAPLRDLMDYTSHRVNNCSRIRNNITLCGVKSPDGTSVQVARFAQHLSALSRGNFLHSKMILDLIQNGHLVTKSSSYKVLPVTLSEIFLLHFNLRFSSVQCYERFQPILCVCLAALNPMTLLELYHSVNALLVQQPVAWDEFMQRINVLKGLLVERSDGTYMLFHPSFRQWLLRRDEGDSTKFLCDPRTGHAAIAMRLSRLEAPLDADKTMELGHHILKAHLYKTCGGELALAPRDLQAVWVALSSDDVSASLGSLRNVFSPNVKVSRLLLLAGASADHISQLRGNSPLLCLAAQEGLVDMVSLLLEFGANCNATTNSGVSALALAAERGHCDVVRMLVQQGAQLGLVDHGGSSALLYATQYGHLNVVGYLLSCDWPSESFNGRLTLAEAAQQALIVASGQGHVHVVEFLLDMAEVRVNLADTLRGHVALTAAAAAGHLDVCRVLIRRGASIRVTNLQDRTALICAVEEGHWEVAEYLLQDTATSVDQSDGTGRTALMVAAAEGHLGVMELLLSKGADAKLTDKEGVSALGWACLRGHRLAVTTLLDKGASVNGVDKNGRTPLDLAATCSDPKIVQILLEKGAVLEHVDLHGMRPLDRAISCRNTPAVQAFLRRGAKLGPATWALAAGKHDIMLILMGKLLDDGNTLYKKQRLRESAQRFQYALKKFPPVEEYGGIDYQSTYQQLQVHLTLNLARCKRKLGELNESIKIATQVLLLRPDSYEALYVRAKARRDLGHLEEAMADLSEAVKVAPAGRDVMVRKVLLKAKEETETAFRQSLTTADPMETSVDVIQDCNIVH